MFSILQTLEGLIRCQNSSLTINISRIGVYVSAQVLFVNIIWLSCVLHHHNKGSSHGQNVLIVLIWSCASKVMCQRSGSLELLQIGWGDSKCDCAVNYDSNLKSSKNWREKQREDHAAPELKFFLLMATGLIWHVVLVVTLLIISLV